MADETHKKKKRIMPLNDKEKRKPVIAGTSSNLPRSITNIIPHQQKRSEKDIVPLDSKNIKRGLDVSENSGDTNGLWSGPTDKQKSATSNQDYVIEPPSAYDRLFAVKHLPLAWKITFGIARDCWKGGDTFPFSFIEPKGIENEVKSWSDEMLRVFRNIGVFRSGPQHMGIGEMDGEAIMLLIEEDFDWVKTDMSSPRDITKPIITTISIPMYYAFISSLATEDWNDDGTPKYWSINLAPIDNISRPNVSTKRVHHSRLIHFVPDPLDFATKGLSVLDRCWQAICIGFNIDLGTGEAFFRWGIGHPVFTTEFEDMNQLETFMEKMGSPNRRTWHALLRGMKLEFAGAGGSSLDFTAGKESSVYDEVAIATGIPRPILKGEVSGVQTGSAINERTYWGLLVTKQKAYNEVLWKLAAVLIETGQCQFEEEVPDIKFNIDTGQLITPKRVLIKWAVHYVETEEQKIEIMRKKMDLITPLMDIFTINELRRFAKDLLNFDDGIPDLPPEIGGQLLPLYVDPYEPEPQKEDPSPEGEPSPKEGPEKKFEKPSKEKPNPDKKVSKKGKKPAELTKARVTPHTSKPGIVGGITQPKNVGEPRKASKKLRESEDMETKGCPKHAYFSKTCPACIRVRETKEDMATSLLKMGFSLNDIRNFVHLNQNKINELRQKIKKDF